MLLDRTDRALLAALQQNCRARLSALGSRVGLAPSSVHQRLLRLGDAGVFRRWTVDLDPQALGLQVLALVGIAASVACSELVPRLAEFGEIEELHSVAGELSLVAKVRTRSSEDLLDLLERLRRLPGVTGTSTQVVLRTHLDRGLAITS